MAVNPDLETAPGMVGADASEPGWFFKIRLAHPSELDGLMSPDDYARYLRSNPLTD